MSLDLARLENKKVRDGKTIARCPACTELGMDGKGEHLAVYPDGEYGCVTHPDDDAHSKRIYRLVGFKQNGSKPGHLSVTGPIKTMPSAKPSAAVITSIPDHVVEDGVRASFICSYPYCDSSGNVLFHVARFEFPPGSEKKKTFRQYAVVDGGFKASMEGVIRVLYRTQEVINADTVCVVEGEKDADELAAHGYTATCNPMGAEKWEDGYTESLRGKNVILCGDNDDKGRRHIDKVQAAIVGVAKSVRHASVPEPAKDISEHLEGMSDTEARAAVEDLLRNATDVTGIDPYRCADWVDFSVEQDAAPEPLELIHGLLHRGSKGVVGGSSKSKKTWSLLDLAVSVASGKPWWEHPTSQGAVVYVDMELSKKQLYKRLKKVLEVRGITLARGQLHLISLRGHVANAAETVKRIRKATPSGIALIILDPIYKFNAGRDENSAGDIGEMLNKLESLAVETGAAVVYAAHYSKGNQSAKESIDRISGSGVYARDADSLIMMTAHEEEDCFAVEPTLRNFAPVDPFVLRWNYPVMERADLDPTKLKKKPGAFETKFHLGQLTDVIAGRTMSSREIEKECCAMLNMSDSTVKRLLKVAEKKGMVQKLQIGLWKGFTP